MHKTIVTLALALLALPGFGQVLRYSPFQYQFSSLPLNPGYASRLPVLGFDAIYFDNFTSADQVSRAVFLNVQGPARAGGMGGSLQFYRNSFFGEMNLRPAYAWRFGLQNGADVSFGAVLGLNYFDLDETVLTSVGNDFFSVDGGVGVFYHDGRRSVGLSVLHFFEKSFGLEDTGPGSRPQRENPFSLQAGTVFRLTDDIDLRPSILLRYINIYELPDQAFGSIAQDLSFDFQLGAFVEKLYVINLLYGQTQAGNSPDQARFGISASYLLGHFRLTYAIQASSLKGSSVSLPTSHLLGAGYDLFPDNEEVMVRFF